MDLQTNHLSNFNNPHSGFNILIVDSRELVGLGIKQSILQTDNQFDVVFINDVHKLTTKLQFHQSAMVIFSGSNSGGISFGKAEEILELFPKIKTAFLAPGFSSLQLEYGLRVKAKGFFLEQDSSAEVVSGINKVFAGEIHFSTGLKIYTSHLARPAINHLTPRSEILALTNRQIEVLVHLAKGSSVKEAAKLMHISEKSVDSHKYRIMHRLNIHDRVELALFALKEGLVDL